MPTVTHLTNQSQFIQSNATFNGTNISGTIASNAISLSVGGGAGDGGNIIAAGGSTANSTGTIVFSNSNNVSFGLNGNTITASASSPAQTAFVFSNSNGVSFGTNGSTVTATVATNYQSQGAYLTTAALSNHSHNFATTTTNGASIIVGTTNSNGATIGVPAFLTTAQPVGAYLTTARASNDAVGLNTALTGNGVAWTVNSSGISLNVPAFLTTAANSTHSHGNPTLALTNLTGTTASASNGFTLSLSAAAPGAGGGIANAAGTQTATSGTVLFNNSNGITFGMSNSSVITASYNSTQFAGTGTSATNASITLNSNGLAISVAAPGGGGGAGTNTALNLTNLTGTLSVNTNGVSISMSAANPGGGAAIPQYWAIPPWGENSHANLTNLTATAMTQRPFFMPFQVQGSLTAPLLKWVMSRATSGSNAFTVQAGVYSYANSTSLGLIGSNQHVFSNSATASVSGIKQFQVTMGTNFSTLGPGQYFLGMNFSAAATASMNYSLMGIATGNFPNQTIMLAGTNSHITYTSNAMLPFWGRYSTTTGAMPAALTYGQVISQTSSNFQMNFTLGQSV